MVDPPQQLGIYTNQASLNGFNRDEPRCVLCIAGTDIFFCESQFSISSFARLQLALEPLTLTPIIMEFMEAQTIPLSPQSEPHSPLKPKKAAYRTETV